MLALLTEFLLVGLGGALGGIGRAWLTGLVTRWLDARFPWGTLVVNVSGSAAIGVLAGALSTGATDTPVEASLRAALIIGMVGSYTTVSSFSLQTLILLRSGHQGPAAVNVVASLLLCITATTLGHAAFVALSAPS